MSSDAESCPAITAYENIHSTGVVIIAPAMGVLQHFYRPFAEWLQAHGFSVLTFDYQGTNSNESSDLRKCKASITDWVEHDCRAVILRGHKFAQGKPVYWLGHSVGAQVVGLVPFNRRISAVLGIAAGSGYWKDLASPRKYYALFFMAIVVPVLVWLNGYYPGKRLGLIGNLPRGVMLQWRRWCLNPTYLGSEDELYVRVSKAPLRITALHLGDDELITMKGVRDLFSLYTSSSISFHRINPSDLGLSRLGHFGFFRASSKAAWPLVLRWIESVERARSSLRKDSQPCIL